MYRYAVTNAASGEFSAGDVEFVQSLADAVFGAIESGARCAKEIEVFEAEKMTFKAPHVDELVEPIVDDIDADHREKALESMRADLSQAQAFIEKAFAALNANTWWIATRRRIDQSLVEEAFAARIAELGSPEEIQKQ